jgi:hypothetical protein
MFWEELITCFPWYMNRIENDASNDFFVAYEFAAKVTSSPNLSLATIGG